MPQSDSNKNKQICWVITEGMAGTQNQCIAVAQALGLDPVIKQISLNWPWSLLSPYLGFEISCSFKEINQTDNKTSDTHARNAHSIKAPWPDIAICSGRKSIAAARYIKKKSGGRTFTLQIQDPRVTPSQFDLVAVPAHDKLRGDNVIVTDTAPNRITTHTLDEAKTRFTEDFGKFKSPRIAFLVGGDSKTHKLTEACIENMCQDIKTARDTGASVLITTSRRTGIKNEKAIQNALPEDHTYFWGASQNPAETNPYFGMMAWADAIVVTEDSVSMVSDALSTGKPVYIYKLEGQSTKFDRFYANIIEKGFARPYEGKIEPYTYNIEPAAQIVANEVRRRVSL